MEEIFNRLCSILKERFDIDIDPSNKEICDMPVFSTKIGMSARALVYLIVILEKEFDITFAPETFDSEEFYTLNNIAQSIAVYKGALT